MPFACGSMGLSIVSVVFFLVVEHKTNHKKAYITALPKAKNTD
jgi:hypothetical protein